MTDVIESTKEFLIRRLKEKDERIEWLEAELMTWQQKACFFEPIAFEAEQREKKLESRIEKLRVNLAEITEIKGDKLPWNKLAAKIASEALKEDLKHE